MTTQGAYFEGKAIEILKQQKTNKCKNESLEIEGNLRMLL